MIKKFLVELDHSSFTDLYNTHNDPNKDQNQNDIYAELVGFPILFYDALQLLIRAQ